MAAETLRTIRLYGHLGARFGRTHRLAVASPAEAVRALCAILEGFERYVMEAKDRGFGFAVLAGKRHVTEQELHNEVAEDIRIAPITLGAKGGLFSIIFGGILIAASFIIPGLGAAVGGFLFHAGAAMVLGGVAQLLAPHPKGNSSKDSSKNTPNYSFNGIVNTEAQGNPVPVVYGGPLKVGSAVISAGIVANDGVYVPTTSASTGSGNSFAGIVAAGVTGSAGSGGGGGGSEAL